MAITTMIQELVKATPFIDTHEHLIEESRRLSAPVADDWLYPCNDWSYLFMHYTQDDLRVAGMSGEGMKQFFAPDIEPADKWRLFEPYWPRARHTGYGQAALRSIQLLFGEADVNAGNVARITEKMHELQRPGFYRYVLRGVAGVESCQVNSLEAIFCETAQPDLLYQDLSTTQFGSGLDLPRLRHETGLPLNTLRQGYDAIDWYFERYGAQAVATKNQSAYERRLNYDDVPAEVAAPLFERHAAGRSLSAGEMKALQDHLWRYTVARATARGLPVKMHTGYYAGADRMPLDRVSRNLQDLCPILQDFPDTKFVLMHITYPYQGELLGLAKQYSNVYVDLCWAWIMNPIATKNFVKEFLVSAPANKLLTFGGDFISVENVAGHASIARQGLAQALDELVAEGWLSESAALDLVEPLMRGNAWELFNMESKTAIARAKVAGLSTSV